MKNTRLQEITFEAKYGTDRVECMREAIVVAIMNGCAVTFEFNGDNYRVHSANLLKVVEKIDK